jgi:hypothetical protein
MLSFCAVVGPAVTGPALGADTFDGVYTGKGVLKKGDPAYPPGEAISVTIHGEALTFSDSNFVTGYEPHPDGSFRDVSVGVDVVLLHGRGVGNVLDADVTDGPCEHHWHLSKKLR